MTAIVPQQMPPAESPLSLRARWHSARAAIARPTIRAALWAATGYAAGQAIRLASNIVLARLLFPQAFGIMTLVNTVLAGLVMFSDVGIRPSIIHSRRGDDPAFLNTAWTIQLGRGFLLFLACSTLAIPLAAFYGEPALRALLPVAGLTALFNGFNSTALPSASRHLRIGLLTSLDIGTALLGAAVMISWAWLAPSPWALLGGSLTTAGCTMVASHMLFAGPRNRLSWDATAYHELFHFGKWIFLSTLTTFCATQADRLVLGKLVPIAELGIYSLGLAIALLPNAMISALCHGVLFSLLAKHVRESRSSLSGRLHDARETLLTLTELMILVIGFEATAFFRLYPAAYADAGWIAVYLTPWIWLRVLSLTLDRAFPALADTRGGAIFELVRASTSLVASIAGFYVAGLPGFIAGLAIGALCGHIAILLLLARHEIYPLGQDLRQTAILWLWAGSIYLAGVLGQQLHPQGCLIAQTVMLAVLAMWAASRIARRLGARRHRDVPSMNASG